MYKYEDVIKQCFPIILKDIEKMLECSNPIFAYKEIYDWVEKNLTRKTWSHHAKMGWRLSYGLKHRCEEELGFYVGNNWIKLAMIENGLDVCNSCYIDSETGKLHYHLFPTADEVLNNSISFIYRKV